MLIYKKTCQMHIDGFASELFIRYSNQQWVSPNRPLLNQISTYANHSGCKQSVNIDVYHVVSGGVIYVIKSNC